MSKRALLLATALALGTGCGATIVKHRYQPLAVKAPPPPAPVAAKPAPVELEATRIVIREKVQFAFGSARILPESHDLLAEVARIMIENPQVTLVQIEGHTDAVGKSRKNRKLSQRRAESVRAFLIEQGVEPARLTAAGFGEERPVAENDSDEGREQNRRVEFNILTQTDEVAKK